MKAAKSTKKASVKKAAGERAAKESVNNLRDWAKVLKFNPFKKEKK